MKSIKDFYKAVGNRRSVYNINNEKVVPEERIIEIIEHAVKHTPSPFNSQSGRVVILLGDNHIRLWNITKETLRKRIAADKFASTEKKMKSFSNGYGTILFFDDIEPIEELQERFPSYADKFTTWAQHSNGMLQYIVWTSLELEGLGASLQHYNPLIDKEVKKEWKIPDSWKLIAQMPFGKITTPPGEKEYKPLEERIKIFK